MDFPSQSPELNITEAVWDYIDREQNQSQQTSKELQEKHSREQGWVKRVQFVLMKKGGHTKY